MTRNDLLRLAGDAGVDPGAVRRFLDGKPVRHATRVLVTASAQRLGISLPSTPSPTPADGREADAA